MRLIGDGGPDQRGGDSGFDWCGCFRLNSGVDGDENGTSSGAHQFRTGRDVHFQVGFQDPFFKSAGFLKNTNRGGAEYSNPIGIEHPIPPGVSYLDIRHSISSPDLPTPTGDNMPPVGSVLHLLPVRKGQSARASGNSLCLLLAAKLLQNICAACLLLQFGLLNNPIWSFGYDAISYAEIYCCNSWNLLFGDYLKTVTSMAVLEISWNRGS
ncbi:hypothetical protein RHMOL_Rhmol05G0174400 [Rhododendron molle]|uniref:Uncharacterized protein n=1 Tax=Rhododendron molle TaxID=49168 RepID=A0ACC0NRQ4_RHOML|nr:hypothetical protein RHMOL_Rhmol05G0174400 [Rhododendron molle]